MKQKKVGFILFLHLAVLAVCALYLWFMAASGIGCPIRRLIGFPCPGCGMSRAAAAMLRLDFAKAFALHPMVFVIFPYLFYAIHCNTRMFRRIKPMVRNVILVAGLASFLGVYFVRLALGIIP